MPPPPPRIVTKLRNIDPLLLPLALDREVEVTSDDAHAKDVEDSLGASTPGKRRPLTGVKEVHGYELISPAELLLELAEVTTPTLLPRRMHDLSLRWAWIHYCWAFDKVSRPPPAIEKMRLSAAARKLAPHRKQVASDDLGVGFGLTLARRALEKRYKPATTEVVDAEELIAAAGHILSAWGITHTGRMVPDYFIKVSEPVGGKSPLPIWILECKGTQGTGHLKQIRKGVTQVGTIKHHPSGVPPPGIISATVFRETSTRVRIVDPPGDEDDPWASTKTSDRIDVFRRDLSQLDLCATLAFAGLYARAAELLPERLRSEPTEQQRSETPSQEGLVDAPLIRAGRGNSASGVRAELPLLGGRTLRATCAVDNRMLNAAERGSVNDLQVARGLVAKEVSEQLSEGEGTESKRRSLVEVVSPHLLRVTARTGLLLEIAVR